MGRRLSTLLLPALACAALAAPGIAAAAQPNILLVLTDDQRWDTVEATMPRVEEELGGHGITFTNAFVVNPLCCPSRATILTGRYSHSTGVYGNAPPYGGSAWFDDSSTIATWLHKAGYRTAYVGKYLNGYGGAWSPPSLNRWFVPPGWDRWLGYEGGYFNYRASVDGQNFLFGTAEEDYSTDVFTREAVSFLDASPDPFFLVYAPYGPHAPATPAPRHADAFTGIPPWRPAAFDEDDVSDKPAWVQARPPLSDGEKAQLDELRRRQLASQLAVDEGVDAILDTLRGSGRLGSTMVVFLSDNGLVWGEHRVWNRKNSAYEESIRVPLIVRYDPLVDAPRSDDRLVANVDLAPTFAALAGAPAPGAEGRSLVPILEETAEEPAPWRSRLLVEHMRAPSGGTLEIPTYCAVRSERFKYVVYSTREEELYDLLADPAELVNRAGDPALRPELLGLRADVRRLCSPAPPGFDPSWLCTLEPDPPGSTAVVGTSKGEAICGRKAGELLSGRGGNDTIKGAGGNDRIYGGVGADQLVGGPGRDLLDGGPGSDIILARDGARDRITCGRGFDVVHADKRDRVARNCEQVRRFRR